MEAKKVKAENMISVGPIGKDLYLIAQMFGWDLKERSILATHAFIIKRSWHSNGNGSVNVCVERVSVISR